MSFSLGATTYPITIPAAATGAIDEKIYQRQVTKLGLSSMVMVRLVGQKTLATDDT